MKNIIVDVKPDHLQMLSRTRKPLMAIAELIWNGVDADATEVRVEFKKNALGGIQRVRVIDNGHGLAQGDAEEAFQNLGGSWKRTDGRTKDKRRILHGRLGKGRFRAFSLGQIVEWTTRPREDGEVVEYTVKGNAQDLRTFELGESAPSRSRQTGTTVEIRGILKNFPSLLGARAEGEITDHFALYLREYPEVRIVYDSTLIDPVQAQERSDEYELPAFEASDETHVEGSLVVIEWKRPAERTLALCDQDGFALAETSPGIQARGFNFTAYLKSRFLRDLDAQNALVLTDLHPDLKELLDSARSTLRDHFRARAAETAKNVVEEWKKDDIYPYKGTPSNPLERAERQVFDILAVRVNDYHQGFREGELDSKKLTLALIREALESSPSSLTRILRDVINLPKPEQDAFAALLERTSLSALIRAGRTVTERLDTIQAFDRILFDKKWKVRLLERTQLHRLLVHELWLLGEQYTLDNDDESLREVLKKHLRHLGRTELAPEVDVKTIEDKQGIPDLMLSRRFRIGGDDFEHLVVELKRPKDRLGNEETSQIERYAFSVIDDERFSKEKCRWTFVLLGNDLDAYALNRATSDSLPPGCIHKKGKVSIWIRTWADVLNEAKARYEFFREQLHIEASSASGMANLHKQYAHLIQGRGKRKKEDLRLTRASNG